MVRRERDSIRPGDLPMGSGKVGDGRFRRSKKKLEGLVRQTERVTEQGGTKIRGCQGYRDARAVGGALLDWGSH